MQSDGTACRANQNIGSGNDQIQGPILEETEESEPEKLFRLVGPILYCLVIVLFLLNVWAQISIALNWI